MRGSIADNLMAEYNPDLVVALANSARTASGAGTSVECPPGKNGKLAVLVEVTAVSGTAPTLDVSIEWGNKDTSFYPSDPADTISQITTVTGDKFKLFEVKAQFFRVVYTIAGTTPSFSFGVHVTGR